MLFDHTKHKYKKTAFYFQCHTFNISVYHSLHWHLFVNQIAGNTSFQNFTVDILFYMDHTILLYLEIATATYSLRCTT